MRTRSTRPDSILSTPRISRRTRSHDNDGAAIAEDPDNEGEDGTTAQKTTRRNRTAKTTPSVPAETPRRLRSGKPVPEITTSKETAHPEGSRARKMAEEVNELESSEGGDIEEADQDDGVGQQVSESLDEDEDGKVEFNMEELQTKAATNGHNQYEAELGEDRVHNGGMAPAESEGENEQSEDGQIQKSPLPSTSTQPRRTPRRGRRRQSQKIPFHEAGYQSPRVASPELGSRVETSKRGRKQAPSPRKRVKRNAENGGRVVEAGARNEEERHNLEEQESDQDEENVESESDKSQKGPGDEQEEQDKDSDVSDQNEEEYDETIFIEPPDDSEDPIIVKIKTNGHEKFFSQMKNRGWVHEPDWKEQIFIQTKENESKNDWIKRQQKGMKTVKCRQLIKHLIEVWFICHDMPKAPEFEEQSQYIRNEKVLFAETCIATRQLVDDIAKSISDQLKLPRDDRSEPRKQAMRFVKDLYKRVIPMLTLLVKESLMIGGASDNEPLAQCEFTIGTLQFLMRINGWIQRLYQAMMSELETHPRKPVTDSQPEKKNLRIAHDQRKLLGTPLNWLDRSLKMAEGDLKRLGEGPRTAEEKAAIDEALRLEREREEDERRQALDRQMSLFIQSTQRMAGKPPTRVRDSGIHHPETRPSGSGPRVPRPTESHSSSQQRSTSQQNGDHEYYEKHGGWYYWEDDKLLKTMRLVSKPDMNGLARLLPHRSKEEVGRRVDNLKDRMRAKYLNANMEPPLWCYHHD